MLLRMFNEGIAGVLVKLPGELADALLCTGW